MNMPGKITIIFLIALAFTITFSISCRKQALITDINPCIPENTVSFVKLSEFYQYKTELMEDEETFKNIVKEIIILYTNHLKEETANETRSKLILEFLSFFNEDMIIEIIKQQALFGITLDENNKTNPYIIISYSKSSSDAFEGFFKKLSDFLKKHSELTARGSYQDSDYDIYTFDFSELNLDSSMNRINNIYASRTGNKIILTANEQDAKNIINLTKDISDRSILKSTSYQKHQKHGVIYPDSPLEYYYSLQNILKKDYSHALTAQDIPLDHQFIKDMTSIIDSISFSLSRNTQDLHLKCFILLNDDIRDKKLLSLIKIPPQNFEFLDFTPRDSLLIGGYQVCNAMDIYSYITQDSPLPAESRDKIAKYAENPDPSTQLTLKDDVIDVLGQEIGFALLSYGNFGFLGTEAVLFLSHKDHEKAGKTMAIVKAIASRNQPFNSFNETYLDYEFTVYPLGVLSPSLLLTDDFIVLGSTRLAVKEIIDTIHDPDQNVYNDPVFSKHIKELGLTKKANIIYISKNREIMNSFLSTLKTLEHFVAKSDNAIMQDKKSAFQLSHDIINYMNVFKSSSVKGILVEDGYLIDAVQKKEQ